MLSILRRPQVQQAVGLGSTRIDELERAGLFPQRVRLSDRACGWRSDEIEEWIEARPRASEVPADRGNEQLAQAKKNKRKANSDLHERRDAERAKERGAA